MNSETKISEEDIFKYISGKASVELSSKITTMILKNSKFKQKIEFYKNLWIDLSENNTNYLSK